MKNKIGILKNWIITFAILVLTFLVSLVLEYQFDVKELIATLFVFAVFLISLLTEGYVYGVCAAVFSTVAVNYAFTFPFFKLNFTIPVNFISATIMVTVAILTCMLTMKIKLHEAWKIEGEKERMRANLLRAISHDLRTPLTTIYGFSETLLDKRESLSTEQKNKMLKGIKSEAQWLIRMVENLLSITKIDAEEVHLNKLPIVLDELIDSVLIKFKKRYPEQRVEIDIPNEVVMIPMDALLIEQVLVNLLENAVQHAEGMQRLVLKVFILSEQAIFEVEDDGSGIPEERLHRIFEGEYSMEAETSDANRRNAGIGLSVCASIIKAHGGDIKAENKKNGGALFRFSLATENCENE
jgi:two-component system sensor histidine kinase KdpD